MSEHDNTRAQICLYTRVLHLPAITDSYQTFADQARSEHWDYEQYLLMLLSKQAAVRERNIVERRLHAAHLPRRNTLEDFNYSYQPSLDRVLITHLATCAFITDASNIVFLGPPGTGETHLAISLGIKACEQGYNVMFKNALDWIRDLEDAQSHGLLNHRLKQLSSIKLLIIDELGYIPLDASAANLLFQLISNRYEHGSVIITSNLEFARWGQTLADPTVAAALIDRLVHHCDIIALKGDSYRTKTRLTTNNKINTQN